MLTTLEKEGFRQILNKLSHEEVDALKDTVTKKLIVTHGKGEAIDAIITFSETALELLKRRKVKRDALFRYLADRNVPVNPAAEKHQLIRKILILWGSHFNDAEIEETVSVESVFNRRMLLPGNGQEIARSTDLTPQGSVVELSCSQRYHRTIRYASNTVWPEHTNHSVNVVNAVQNATAQIYNTPSTASDNSITTQILGGGNRNSQRDNSSVRHSTNTVQSTASEIIGTAQSSHAENRNSRSDNSSVRHYTNTVQTVTAHASKTQSTASEKVITAQSSRARDRNSRRDNSSVRHSTNTVQTVTAHASKSQSTASVKVITAQSSHAGDRNSRRDNSSVRHSTNTVQSVTARTSQTRSTASENIGTAQSSHAGNHNSRRDNSSVRHPTNTVQSVTAHSSQTRSTASENIGTAQSAPLGDRNNQKDNRSIRNSRDTQRPCSERTASENVVPHQSARDRSPLHELSSQRGSQGEYRSILHSTDTVQLPTESTCLVTKPDAAENAVAHQSQPDKNFELGKEFVKWYYKILNSYNPSLQSTPDGEFGPQHFWSDCRLKMQSVVQGEVNVENFEGSGIVANRCLALVKEERLLFNPNIDMDGIKVKTEPHGLVLVLTCGTLHRVNDCLGVFEQLFGLISDPAMDNNWKVKMSTLAMKSSQHPTMPKLGNGEQMLAIEPP